MTDLCSAQTVSACYRFSYLSGLVLCVALRGWRIIRDAVAALHASILNERYLVGSELQNLNRPAAGATANPAGGGE